MHCPSCGGEIPADARFARLVVCHFCNSAIVLDEKAARVSGKMAVLVQTPSPFFVGGTGVLLDRRFTILGRVRYGYSKGYWDEWFLGFEDGGTAWISEDENNFTLESCDEIQDFAVDYATTLPGSTVHLGETAFHVDEKDVAECEGGEGQLPFAVMSGERVPFLDISQGELFGTIEFDIEDETVRVFSGRRLDISEVQMDATAEEAGVVGAAGIRAERAAGEGKRERIVTRDDRSKGMNCYACGGPLELPDVGVDSMTCTYCGVGLDLTLQRVSCPNCSAAVMLHGGKEAKSTVCRQCDSRIDVSKPEPSLLGTLLSKQRPVVPFALGQKCRFDEHDYTIIGHVRFVQRDAWGTYRSDEFLLYGKEAGYRWLIRENGHHSLSAELDERPMGFNVRTAMPKQKFNFLDQTWKVFERAENEIEWVDGELPWVAKVGDRTKFMDAIAPPYMLSSEWTESELEWFLAEYKTREEIAEAFKIQTESLLEPLDIAPNQPYPGSAFRQQSAVVLGFFALLFAAFGVLAFLQHGQEIRKIQVSAEAYSEEYITTPFVVTRPNALCKARFSSPVDNAWIYLDVAVINERDEAVLDFSAEMSYYHGYEGGESWSEGSKKDTVVFKLDDPGEYRFLVLGQTGAGSSAPDARAIGRPVTIRVYQGASLARYHLFFAIICIGWAGIEWLRRWGFEKKRWGDEDDDD